MSSTKYEGLSHLTHFLKSRVSVVGDTFLITELNKPAFFAKKCFMHFSLQTKQKKKLPL